MSGSAPPRAPSISQFEEIVRGLRARASKRPVLENVLPLTIAVTGARVSEALELTTVDIDFDRSQLYIVTLKQKARPKRVVPVPSWMTAILSDYIVRNTIGYKLFPVSRPHAWRIVRRATGYHPHALRHALAMYLLYNGVDPETVRRILGHSSWKLVEYYVRIVGAKMRQHPLETLF